MTQDSANMSLEDINEKIELTEGDKENEINALIVDMDDQLWFFASKVLHMIVGKDKLRTILTEEEFDDKESLMALIFDDEAKLFGSKRLGWAANWIGKMGLEATNLFVDIYSVLQEKNKEIKEKIEEYKIILEELKEDVKNNQSDKDKWNGQWQQEQDLDDDMDNPNTNSNDMVDETVDEDLIQDENIIEEEDVNTDKSDLKRAIAVSYSAVFWAIGFGAMTWNASESLKIKEQITSLGLNNIIKQQETLDDMIKYLEDSKKWNWYVGEYGEKAKEQIDITISKIKEAKKDIATLDSQKVMVNWKSLSESGIMDNDTFRIFSEDGKLLDNLESIVKKWWLEDLKTLIKTDPNEAKKLLGITNSAEIPPSLIKTIENISDISDIKKMSKVLKFAEPIWRMGKFLGKLPYFDLVFVGVDIWVANQWFNEANEIAKYNEMRWQLMRSSANTHLAIGLATAVPEFVLLWLALASAWPPGWVAWAVWIAGAVVAVTADHFVDTLYFDVQNLYAQNKEDFKKQYRTEIKQAIVQISLSATWSIDSSSNENIANRIKAIRDDQKISALEAAYEVMIWMEEWWEYADEDRIKLRMEYISKHMKDEEIINSYKSLDLNGANFNAVGEFVAKSNSYANMIQNENYQWEENIDKYIETLSSEISNAENATSFAFLDAMDDVEFYWFYKNILDFEYFALAEWDSNYEQKILNIEFIKKYYQVKSFGIAEEEINSVNTESSRFYNEIWDFLSQDTFVDSIETVTYDENELVQQYTSSVIEDTDNPKLENVSNDPTENMLYHLIKGLHGYTWNNNMQEMISFLPRSKKESLWLFFGGSMIQEARFRINNDWATDWRFSLDDLMDMNVTTDEIMQKLIQPSMWLRWINKDSGLDTVTESADDILNMQFWREFAEILEEERLYLSYYKKFQVQNEIEDYIENNLDGKYGRLPYHLMDWSIRTWLWDCQNCFFSYENGEIIVVTPLAYQDRKIEFADKKKIIERPYDQLNETEQDVFDKEIFPYITQVDNAKDELLEMVSLRSWQKDYLDIPEEYEIIIANKIKERELLKESIYDYTPLASKKLIQSKYENYFSWFNNVYIGILIASSGNIVGKDLDNADTMNMVLSWNQMLQIDIADDWNIVLNFAGENFEKDTDNENAEKFFELVDNYKIEYDWWKYSINELFKKAQILLEGDEAEQMKWLDLNEKIKRYMQQIWKSLLEVGTVKFDEDEDGNVTISGTSSKAWRLIRENRWLAAWVISMSVPMFTVPVSTVWGFVTKKIYKHNEESLLELILADNLAVNKYVDLNGYSISSNWDNTMWSGQNENFARIKNKTFELWLKNLSMPEKTLIESSWDIQKNIESTNEKYVRQSERWDIKIKLAPTPYCESRWLRTPIEFGDNTISIANVDFDITNKSEEELENIFWQVSLIGNLVNMIKHEFAGTAKKENPFFINKNGELNFKHKDRKVKKLRTSLKILEADSFDKILEDDVQKNKFVLYLNELSEFGDG